MITAATRLASVLTVVAALSFLVTGCGGGSAHNGVASVATSKTTTTQSNPSTGSSSPGQSAPTEAQLLKYAECMRAHGLSDFPDPVRSPLGGYGFHVHMRPGSDLDPYAPRYESAEKACEKHVPPSIANATPAVMAANALKWSECMRSHGEPDFPGPNGQGLIKVTHPTGIMNPHSPQFQRAEKACRSLGSSPFVLQITPNSGSPGGPSPGT